MVLLAEAHEHGVQLDSAARASVQENQARQLGGQHRVRGFEWSGVHGHLIPPLSFTPSGGAARYLFQRPLQTSKWADGGFPRCLLRSRHPRGPLRVRW